MSNGILKQTLSKGATILIAHGIAQKCDDFLKHAVGAIKSNTNLHQSSYIPRTSRLWNSLSANIVPPAPNMDNSKKCVYSYLISIL